jgi:transposase, IS30 family
MTKGKKFAQLQESERIKIEVLLQQGFSYSRIAASLGRSVSTISREVVRNQSRRGKRPVYYSSRIAQAKTRDRHYHKRKRVYFDESMKARIAHWLINDRLSPELISVLGRRECKDFVSYEWIYQWIWRMKRSLVSTDQSWRRLYKYLKHAKRRQKRGNQRMRRGNIIDRVWIDQRPVIITKRCRTGDLEADLVLGKGRKAGLLVAIDRKSRKTWIRKLANKEAGYIVKQLNRICDSVGDVKTITFDNDQAFAQHYRLKERNIDTFFTHPYSSQEKGSVENRIGLIRMFFPKKTDFSSISDREISKVQQLLNNRPMRMFNYKSPNEIHIS